MRASRLDCADVASLTGRAWRLKSKPGGAWVAEEASALPSGFSVDPLKRVREPSPQIVCGMMDAPRRLVSGEFCKNAAMAAIGSVSV
jgi:hypothetical protein